MKIPVVSYSRFSSQNQREASIEIQQEHINKYCDNNGLEIIKEYVDRAQSATTDNRPSFQQMIADAQNGEFTAVVVYNSSRFCRNIQDHLRYREILESYNVRIISVQEGFDELTPEGDLMANFMMSINQYYSKDLSRKIYLGCLENARKGLHIGGPPPYGYKVNENKTYEIDEKEAKIVKMIFDGVLKGLPYTAIANDLNEKGFRRRNGKEFTPFFYDILKNRKYIGEYVWNKTKKRNILGNRLYRKMKDESEVVRIPNGMPVIISKEDFEKVQKIIESRKSYKNQRREGKYLLSSIVVCKYCGYRMSGETNTNGNGKGTASRIAYHCDSKRRRGTNCVKPYIKAIELESYILNLVRCVLLNEKLCKSFKRIIKKKISKNYETVKEKVESLEKEIQILTNEIEELIKVLSQAKSVAYNEILLNIEKKSSIKLKKTDELEIERKELHKTPIVHENIISKNMDKFKRIFNDGKERSKKAAIKSLIKTIFVSTDKIEIVVNLNAYLDIQIENSIEMVITESREAIESRWQDKAKLTWSVLDVK